MNLYKNIDISKKICQFSWSVTRFFTNPYFFCGCFLLPVFLCLVFSDVYFLCILFVLLNFFISVVNFFSHKVVFFSKNKNFKNFLVFWSCFFFLNTLDIILLRSSFHYMMVISTIFLIFCSFFIFKYKKKHRIPFFRSESWMVACVFTSVACFLDVLFYFTTNLDFFVLVFQFAFSLLFLSCLFFSLNYFFSEYTRLRGLQIDMQERDVEIMEMSKHSNEAARLKGEFLANMGHELRTPLNGIIGCSTMLLDTDINNEQREYLETLRNCGNNLLMIISEILDFSKIEANRLEIEKIPFEINKSIEDVFDLLSGFACEKQIDLVYQIDTDVPKILVGDMNRIQQILTNLLDNAIKFTKTGYAFVHVRCGKSENEKRKIFFTVQDTGVGIPKESIGKLFQTFTQLDDSFTRQYGGTGLGLSIAKKLTEIMGGSIQVKSALGKGSVFSFFVEVFDSKEEKNQDSLGLEKLSKKRILLCDPCEKLLEVLKFYCEQWGMEVMVSSTEETSMLSKENKEFHPDIVVVSISSTTDLDRIGYWFEKQKEQILIPLVCSSMYHQFSQFKGKIMQKPMKMSYFYEALVSFVSRDQEVFRSTLEENQSLGLVTPLRILVAEDNVVNQKLIVNVLKKFSYTCDLVANGKEVLEALTRRPYDILFMDVQMPELDGIDATMAILKKYPDMRMRPRIIAMTAYARGPEVQRCLDAGMEGYLPKPIDLRELKKLLQFWGARVSELKK